jgi:NodT family efflux transporter outer membrane factor (OMF) lipoprotein
LAWELDVWGRLNDTRFAARLDTEQAAANLQAARLSLAANTAKGWFNLAETELQSQLAKQTLSSYTNNLAVLEEGLQRGLTKALDVHLMRTSVHNAQNNLQLRIRERDSARRSLEILLGRYPKSKLALNSGLPSLTNAVPAGLPSQLIERRPDVLSAQRAYQAAHKRVDSANKDRLPKFSLTASYGTSSDELENVLDINNNIWNLAANLTKPIFDAGKIKSQVQRAKAQREQAKYQYVQTTLQAFAEVETALAAETFLVKQETALSNAAKEANEAEKLAQDDYLAGLAGLVTVLESQRRVFDAKRSLIDLQNLRLQNRIDLYLALGGEFSKPEPKPETE